jgi:hypothetical protein
VKFKRFGLGYEISSHEDWTMSFANQINPLILDELRRLKAKQENLPAKPTPDRIERMMAALTTATLRQLASLQVQLQA